VSTLEKIFKSNGNFPGDFEVNQRLTDTVHLHGKAWKTFFEKFLSSEAIDADTDDTLSL